VEVGGVGVAQQVGDVRDRQTPWLTLAAWTLAVVSSIPNTGFRRVLRPSGVVAGGLVLAALGVWLFNRRAD
jgi:hypothetical protein